MTGLLRWVNRCACRGSWLCPEESAATITLAPANGSWIDATAVEILVSDGDRVVGTAQPVVRQTESTTVLDQENGANGVWLVPCEG